MKKTTQDRAKIAQELVKQHYQPERQDRCLLWVYRNVVRKQLPVSERTFWRYLKMDTAAPPEKEEGQLKLF